MAKSMTQRKPGEKLVAYYRVSTKKQGESGLGLEAQKACVEGYAGLYKAVLIKEFIEVESGKKDNRPQLQAAIRYAKMTNARLIIAKLDRLSRNAAFLMNLQESQVDFVACDIPDADETTVGIYAVMAQRERKLISTRTKDALDAAKARGVKLGNPDALTTEAAAKGRQAGTEAIKARAKDFAENLLPVLQELKADGLKLQAIADELNAKGFVSARGGKWSPMQVKRVLDRA